MKPTYTSADPVSLSAMIISIGNMTVSTARKKWRMLSILNPGRLISHAITSDVVIFDSSAGWNFTGPSSNHECDPLTLLLMKITMISSNTTTPYAGRHTLSQKYGLMTNSISTASTSALPIQSACLPQLNPRSKIDDGSPERTAA